MIIKSSRNSDNKPKLSPERIEEYEQAGQWPPPAGLIILNEKKPSAAEVGELLTTLSSVVTPKQRKTIDRAKELNGQKTTPF